MGVLAELGAFPWSDVEIRLCALTHFWAAGSGYLTALPILTKGGPSPRILAFANQLTDTCSWRANSVGVSSLNATSSPIRSEEAGLHGPPKGSFRVGFFIVVASELCGGHDVLARQGICSPSERMWRADAKLLLPLSTRLSRRPLRIMNTLDHGPKGPSRKFRPSDRGRVQTLGSRAIPLRHPPPSFGERS
jgi:hypothetical protein